MVRFSLYNLFHYQEFIGGLQLEELHKLVTMAYSNEGCVELARALLQDPSQEMKHCLGVSATSVNQWILLKRMFAAGKDHFVSHKWVGLMLQS